MCGIAGIALKPGAQISPDLIAALARGLAHRGPDGMGSHVSARALLVQTRLAIVDLATGDQPLFGAGSALIGNGEIYNNQELRASMPGISWSSLSDCEPPLYIARDQPDLIAPLRGMFALALDRGQASDVLLARDPFGIKPLYTARTDHGLAFASEPQVLIGAGLIAATLRAEPLVELLQLQFTTGTNTVFSGIERVAPGEMLVVRDGEITERHPHPAIEPGNAPASEDQALARLDQILQESVELHQRSDVPYGMFLSGGIDSAAILALMARLNSSKVLAFTAGFDTSTVADERDAAACAAQAVGARHERIEITEAMMWRDLPRIVAAMDDPVADYAIIPTWFLARHAATAVKVVLSGEGGDEMFAGYGRYRAAMRPWPFRRAMRATGAFDGLGILRASGRGWRAGLAAREATIQGSRLSAAQRADIADWLPNDLLLKLDRCLMAHGVEGRTPFVDKEVARFALALPDRLRVQHGYGKYLLRRWLERHLPAARPFAPKQGFDVPVSAWIAQHGAALGALVARAPIIAELAEPAAVRQLFGRAGDKKAGMACWRLLFLALWHHRHGLGGAIDGDAFEVLAG